MYTAAQRTWGTQSRAWIIPAVIPDDTLEQQDQHNTGVAEKLKQLKVQQQIQYQCNSNEHVNVTKRTFTFQDKQLRHTKVMGKYLCRQKICNWVWFSPTTWWITDLHVGAETVKLTEKDACYKKWPLESEKAPEPGTGYWRLSATMGVLRLDPGPLQSRKDKSIKQQPLLPIPFQYHFNLSPPLTQSLQNTWDICFGLLPHLPGSFKSEQVSLISEPYTMGKRFFTKLLDF